MRSNQDIIHFQTKLNEIEMTENFRTVEDYCIHLLHLKAYEEAAMMADGKTVLDLGCNNGYGTEVISQRCNKVIGVDISPRAIEEARRRFGANGIEFQLVDGKWLPFKEERFDLIVSFQVIEHIGDCDTYLSEIKRVLSPGGVVLFTTPNAYIRLDPGMKPWNRLHIREFRAGELEELLRIYFPKVSIRGLFASGKLYLVEFNRVRKAREEARRKLKGIYPLLSKVRDTLPYLIVKQINKVRRFLNSIKSPNKFDSLTLQQYSTADLFYREENLDEALDLMAICLQDSS